MLSPASPGPPLPPRVRLIDRPLAHGGFPLPNRFVLGSSLDYPDRGRTLPYSGVRQPPDGLGPGSWP